MAHITGGGITENLDRAMPKGLDALVRRGGEAGPAWDVPPVITYMVREGRPHARGGIPHVQHGRGHGDHLRRR